MAVTLADLVREIPGATAGAGVDLVIHGVHHDSRAVASGDLFVARPGATHDGLAFIDQAIARGAVAVLAHRGKVARPLGVPLLEVDDVPRALAFAAAAVYGHPTFALEVVGITGTNGKTTTAHLVAKMVEASGGRPAVIGTLGASFEGVTVPSKHTSPEADELARLAADLKARGATHLVMEVSSIALAAARADAIRFRVAALTNLTQDHLDYHGTMAAYAAAKARLFTDLGPSSAAVNVDDPFGREIAGRLAYGVRKARYSADPKTGADHAEVTVARAEQTAGGIRALFHTPIGDVEIASPLVGAHNVENLLCAASIGVLLDQSPEEISRGLSAHVSVPGRLERCDDPAEDDVVVLVDYAHTPDALERVLASARAMTHGEVVCVFGCGGDRDVEKRPLMGEAVGRAADRAYVTNDNPRSERPEDIIAAITVGLRKTKGRFEIEPDRGRAIDAAIESANRGDVVLIAGKGHETYQIIGNDVFEFDDRVVARRALAARRSRREKAS